MCWLTNKSGDDSRENARLYIEGVHRILVDDGVFLVVSHREEERRFEYFDENLWERRVFKLYRTSVEEEQLAIQKTMLECRNVGIENSDFSVTLKDNLTENDLEEIKFKNFHYAYIFKKKKVEGEEEDNKEEKKEE